MLPINDLERLLKREETEVWMKAAIDIGRYSEQEEALRIINYYLQTPITYHMSRHVVCALAAYLSHHYQEGDLDESKITNKTCFPAADSPKTIKPINASTIPWIGKQLSKLVLYGLSMDDKPTIKVSYVNDMPVSSSLKTEYKNILLYYSNAIAKKQEMLKANSTRPSILKAIQGLERAIDRLDRAKKELEKNSNSLSRALMDIRASDTAWPLIDCKLEPWLMSSLFAGFSEYYISERFGIPSNYLVSAMVNIASEGVKPNKKGMSGDQRMAHIINLPRFLTNNYQPVRAKELSSPRKILLDIQKPNYEHSSEHWMQFTNSINMLN